MADADYFLDRSSSSPDPLADDIPTSVRSASRRTTKSQYELSSLANPQSSPQKRARASSPRKRTFQLNVGDGLSPHRIRVTVEAEDVLKRDNVHRKLFPPSSPARSARRRQAITTTTVPLNDEPEPAGVSTPRRARRRRTSNGTPMPRGKKREGTPLQSTSTKHQRRDDGVSSSDAAISSDGLTGMNDDGEETPKPRTRLRKTPIKPPASASKAPGSTAGKKRGRPRKVLAPIEPDVPDVVAEDAGPTLGETNSYSNAQRSHAESSGMAREEIASGSTAKPTAGMLRAPPRRRSNITSIIHLKPAEEPARIDRLSSSPASLHQGLAENDDNIGDNEDFQGMEPQSDLQSEVSEDGARHERQDTIAEASEFSMIAIDSLPSFQASFQDSFHGEAVAPSSDQQEMGEETSRIINETIESLRRSLQTEKERHSQAAGTGNDSRIVENPNEDRTEILNQSVATTNYNGERASSRSPGRPNTLSSSRQGLLARGHVDESFSTIPDSILHAATPGRLPMKPTASEHDHHDGQIGAYDDSFSEIPGDVEATPRPPGRVDGLSRRSPAKHDQRYLSAPSAGRTSNYGSARLLTPDETSSSNAGSKKTHEEDVEASPDPPEHLESPHRADIPSSPPRQTRPRALDYGPSDLQRELNGAQEKPLSSPQQQSSGKASSNPPQSLDVPLPVVRPSLSPIVRVGRTLQNVLSDNSSPEAREGSLRSPFRGPRSSVPRSPSPSIRNRGVANKPLPSADSPIRLDRTLYPKLEKNPGPASQNSAEAAGPSGVNSSRLARTESRWNSVRTQSREPVGSLNNPSITSSTRAIPSTENERSWTVDGSRSQKSSAQEVSSQTTSYRQGSVGTRGTSEREVVTTLDTELHSEQDNDHRDGSLNGDLGEEEPANDYYDDDDDELDVWDIEASRTSPLRPDPEPDHTMATSKLDISAPRRNMVPSPWRRNNRRLIYKDNIASSSQIEIEESSQSEIEERSPVQESQPPATETSVPQQSAPQPSAIPSTAIPLPVMQPSTIQPPAPQPSAPQPPTIQRSAVQPSVVQPSASQPSASQSSTSTSQTPAPQLSTSQPRQDTYRSARDPTPVEESPVQEELPEHITISSSSHSNNEYEDDVGLADFEEHDDDDDLMQYEELEAPREPEEVAQVELAAPKRPQEEPEIPEVPLEIPKAPLVSQATLKAPEQPREILKAFGVSLDMPKAPAVSQATLKGPQPREIQKVPKVSLETLKAREQPREMERAPEVPLDMPKAPTVSQATLKAPPQPREIQKVPEVSLETLKAREQPREITKAPAVPQGKPHAPEQLQGLPKSPEGPQYLPLMDDEQMERDAQQELEDFYGLPSRKTPAEVSESPLVAQQPEQTPLGLGKSTRSKFFSALDMLKFFSSPATLPTLKSPGIKSPAPQDKPPIQPALMTQKPKEPPRGLWSIGLFPSLPLSNSRLSAEQSSDAISPNPPERSSDSVVDTYEPSSMVSPSPGDPAASAEPSTPESQVFPPIEQKRNFTPRPGESRGSLFSPSQPGSSATRDNVTNDNLEGSSDEQESSGMTEGSEYERVPPRETPSQWDRHLSPSKSCFRSPLKPTAHGRVVAFSNNLLFPPSQTQARNALESSSNVQNTIAQGPPLQPRFEGKENQPHADNSSTRANNDSLDRENTNNVSRATRTSPQPRARSFAAAARSSSSHASWSKEHWIRLRHMMWLRRSDPLRFQQECALPPPDRRRSSALLGSRIWSKGALILLEPWHLDVVDAFRLEVGAWDDGYIAMRVFALVAAAERRRAAAAAASASGSR